MQIFCTYCPGILTVMKNVYIMFTYWTLKHILLLVILIQFSWFIHLFHRVSKNISLNKIRYSFHTRMRELVHVSSDLTRLSNVKITYFFDFNPCKYVFHLKQNSRKTLENDTKVLFTFQKKSQLMINNESHCYFTRLNL